jgi:mono/diheme cytochrome c family protein
MRYFLLLFLLSVIAVVGICGFQGSRSRRPPIELFPDMVRQNKVRPQTAGDFFADQLSSRPIPAGTIPRQPAIVINGQLVYPYEDSPVNTGKIPGTTNFIAINPRPPTRQLLDRGQRRYQINCLPCHGPLGDGRGITSKYNMFSMANFHDQRLVDMPDGEIFDTISHGKNLMGSYGAHLTIEERWVVIYYVRALERSQLGSVEDVPEPERAQFKK